MMRRKRDMVKHRAYMTFRSRLLFCVVLTAFFGSSAHVELHALQAVDSTRTESSAVDSSAVVAPPSDSTSIQKDSTATAPVLGGISVDSTQADRIRARQNRSGLDTIVNLFSVDSAVYMIRRRRIELHGDARLDYGKMQLQAQTIELLLDSTMLRASAGRDSSGRLIGIPRFNDGGEEFYGEQITYNFATKKGTVSLGETVVDNGFYFGDKIKRVNENTLFVQNGCFTTCDHPNPHFYFKSPEMKVITDDRIFLDPLIVYVEDVPVFGLPFGVFFENKRGRRSGILIPSFYFSGAAGSSNRGIVFENVGYYWALDDYTDNKLWGTITTKGGYELWDEFRWVVRDQLNSTVRGSFGTTRLSPDSDESSNWSLYLRHNQTLNPQENITATIDVASPDFNRETQTDLDNRVIQSIYSNASYTRSFNNGSVLSLNYSRDQNLLTNRINETLPELRLSFPRLQPLRSLVDRDSWLANVALSGNMSAFRRRQAFELDPIFNDDSTEILLDARDSSDVSQRISLDPSISIAPKLGYFTLTPSFDFNANVVFRERVREYDAANDRTVDSFRDGTFFHYDYSFGLALSTKLFGLIEPDILGLRALRHTFQPTFSYSYRPDFSDPSFGYYDEYFDESEQEFVPYSRYSADGISISQQLTSALRVNLDNTFEAKIAQPDTIPDKVIKLFTLGLSGSYNFAADSLRFSSVSANMRTNLAGLSFTSQATFNLYDYDEQLNSDGEKNGLVRTVDRLMLDAGKGLARLDRASLSLSTSFGSRGIQGTAGVLDEGSSSRSRDSVDYGARFRLRDENIEEDRDLFGDSSPGFNDFSIPWDIDMTASFSYTASNPFNISRSLTVRTGLNLSPTATWNIRTSMTLDLIDKEINAPEVRISKDIHCWELSLRWVPTGFSQGFYLRFGVKAPQLRDLKLEKRGGGLY